MSAVVVHDMVERNNENLRAEWWGHTLDCVQRFAVESDEHWVVECVEAFFETLFQYSPPGACLFATVRPLAEFNEQRQCILEFTDVSHLLEVRHVSEELTRSVVRRGERGKTAFKILMMESTQSDQYARAKSKLRDDYLVQVGDTILEWCSRRGALHLPKLVYGVLAALKYLGECDFHLSTDLETIDYTQDRIELRVHNPEFTAWLTIDMVLMLEIYARICKKFEEAEQSDAQTA